MGDILKSKPKTGTTTLDTQNKKTGVLQSGKASVLFLLPPLLVNLQGFPLQTSGEVFAERGLLLEILEISAGFPMYADGLDVFVGIKVGHGFRSFTFESGVELSHFCEVDLVAFGHLVGHGLGNGGDDSLVVALAECRPVENDIVQKFVDGQRLLILCAGVCLFAALRIAWVATHDEGIFHNGMDLDSDCGANIIKEKVCGKQKEKKNELICRER